jgi:hypothetical protein
MTFSQPRMPLAPSGKGREHSRSTGKSDDLSTGDERGAPVASVAALGERARLLGHGWTAISGLQFKKFTSH